MLVTRENFEQALAELSRESVIAVDCETTGLRAYHGDRPFGVAVATKNQAYYFNFNSHPDIEPLPDECFKKLETVFTNPQITKILHNAKFDMAQLQAMGCSFTGPIMDLWVLDRLHNNEHFAYTLSDVAKRWGRTKSTAVDECIKKMKLTEAWAMPSLNKKGTHKFFSQVPFEIMHKYAENDARITFDVAMDVLKALEEKDKLAPASWGKLTDVLTNEMKLTETLFRMESRGVRINREYCEEARSYYQELTERSAKEFERITGKGFVKGETVFKEVFKDEALKYSEKGNPVFDAKSMRGFKHPAAAIVIQYAEAKKQLEYFQNFLYAADANDVIHTDYCQAGTTTGRLSNRDPNLQNLTNPDKYGDEDEKDSAKYPVRRSFVPRKGYFFAMLDFEQVEYRVMLDVAKANAMINEILGGLDVHAATSKIASVTRKHAKTVNFLSLYGGGVAKLAMDLFETHGSLKQLQVIWISLLHFRLNRSLTC